MRKLTTLFLLVPAIVLSACGRNAGKSDDALKNDLALASQIPAYAQFNPAEQGANPYNPYGYNPYVAQQYPTAQRAPAPVAPRTTTARRTTSSASSRSSSSGTIYSAPAPEPQVIKHTKRDAAIGAAAGAIIGAATSRDRIKGGLIGAAIGGVLGGVIGNNVDVKRKY
jgi:hypothetical protein